VVVSSEATVRQNKEIPLTTNRFRAGFTAVELLVVISILTLLVAILLPVFARTREAARHAPGGASLRQQATAYSLYAADYDRSHQERPALAATGTGVRLVNPYEDASPCATAEPRTPAAKAQAKKGKGKRCDKEFFTFFFEDFVRCTGRCLPVGENDCALLYRAAGSPDDTPWVDENVWSAAVDPTKEYRCTCRPPKT
jgi:prepilin-type N-terminal cleavage/methylation domain-containing protein